jgi:hypothetical protein
MVAQARRLMFNSFTIEVASLMEGEETQGKEGSEI